jgi:hypothetical protein
MNYEPANIDLPCKKKVFIYTGKIRYDMLSQLKTTSNSIRYKVNKSGI